MKAKHPNPPYATGETLGIINNIILVNRDYDFDDNPLFYVNSEYPKHKLLDARGYLVLDYEFYIDKAGNKYMVMGGELSACKEHAAELLKKADFENWARNVDEFVEGVDVESYEHWLDLIS